jgi:TonB dependent receptor-like, beta-barrel/Carboxypeptidase regulatory-like domain
MTSRLMASAAVGGLMVLGFPAISSAQRAVGSPAKPVGRIASVVPGSIQGLVRDERESPVAGAVVTALGTTAILAVTDDNGLFELPGLPAGSYVVTAHLNGYFAPPAQTIEISSGARRISALVLRRARPSVPLLVAGIGAAAEPEPQGDASAPGSDSDPTVGDETPETDTDHSETAWRLRHARRSVLKDVALPADLLADDRPADTSSWRGQAFSRAVGSPARFATSFFADTAFSGQVNFLTAGSFETPKELFSSDSLARGIAYVRLGAPVGTNGDWAVRGALTQADISSWILAGSYATRAPAQHKYDLGWSYSTQRYDGGNVLARRDVADGSRNVGTMYGFDTFTINRALTVSYGSRYARYDFLEDRNLVSPRVEVTMTPAERTRLSAVVSRTAQAPGAQEFLPPGDTGIWLPPQRTFSSIEPGRPLRAEHTTNLSVELERDFAGSTVSLRAFRQDVDDQLATLFGADLPAQPNAKIGHYFVGNVGDVSAIGCTAGLRTLVASRVQGSIAYSLTNAQMTNADDLRYLVLLAPTALHRNAERIHDVATSIETSVPETSTRVLVLYRVSNGFARPSASQGPDRPGLGSRFDVQVRQSLPFLNFTSAKWEMLIAVRDFFSETAVDQSVYDELLVVRPPKRIVGGVTMHF